MLVFYKLVWNLTKAPNKTFVRWNKMTNVVKTFVNKWNFNEEIKESLTKRFKSTDKLNLSAVTK